MLWQFLFATVDLEGLPLAGQVFPNQFRFFQVLEVSVQHHPEYPGSVSEDLRLFGGGSFYDQSVTHWVPDPVVGSLSGFLYFTQTLLPNSSYSPAYYEANCNSKLLNVLPISDKTAIWIEAAWFLQSGSSHYSTLSQHFQHLASDLQSCFSCLYAWLLELGLKLVNPLRSLDSLPGFCSLSLKILSWFLLRNPTHSILTSLLSHPISLLCPPHLPTAGWSGYKGESLPGEKFPV